MMKKRNVRVNEAIEIIARTKAKKLTVIIACACVLLFVLIGKINYETVGTFFGIVDIIVIIVASASLVLLSYYGLKEAYTNQERYNAKLRKTKEKLKKGSYVEVIPLKESEFISDLCNRAQFFATAGTNKVHILIKYNGENNYIPYELSDKGYFWDEYELM